MSELLEKILDNRNMNEAYKKVCANKGAGGVDGMELNELYEYINKNWDSIYKCQDKNVQKFQNKNVQFFYKVYLNYTTLQVF